MLALSSAQMPKHSRRLLALLPVLAVLLPAAALARGRAPRARSLAQRGSDPTLLRSPELWATIDVCNPPKQSDWIGVRGSMPSDGNAHDKMYMRFALEHLSAVNAWSEVDHTPWERVALKHAAAAGTQGLQAGEAFELGVPKGTWRGRVDFKWVRGATVLQMASRLTTRGREVTEGAEPAGYSAASCKIS